MIDIRTSAVIPRPVEEVFEFVSNLENWPKWEHHILDVQQVSPDGVGAGARYSYVTRISGRAIPSTMVVTSFRPLEEISFEGDWAGPVQPHGNLRFERVDGGTRITLHLRPRTRLGFKWLEPKIARVMREAEEKSLARLQSLMAEPNAGSNGNGNGNGARAGA